MSAYPMDSEQLMDVSKLLEHLAETDGSCAVVYEAEVGLMTKDGVYIGKAIYNSDTDLWFFEAATR